LNGIDYIESDGATLCVHLFGDIPADLGKSNMCVTGGRRIRGIRVLDVKPDSEPDMHDEACLRVTLDRPGDHSAYCLCLVADGCAAEPQDSWKPYPGFDERYACAEFKFHLDCPQPLDCESAPACPPRPAAVEEINYLAKDYASFRQLILDRLALKMPQWSERRVPDLGIALVEVLAYTADYLSYYQDAVATEAYLATARKRISVRRHARLVDYKLHEGCNARALLTIATDTERDFAFSDVRFVVPPQGQRRDAAPGIITASQLDVARTQGATIFEPVPLDGATSFTVVPTHSSISIYTWGDELCCLPRGSTSATLVDFDPNQKQRVLKLVTGDLLIFEEVLGTQTGNPADADPSHRHAVRLISVEQGEDPLYGVTVLEVTWDPCDALPFDLCLSVRKSAPDCSLIEGVSIVRGNVVLADHGDHEPEESWTIPGTQEYGCCSCDGAVLDVVQKPSCTTHTLKGTPVTYCEPIPPHAPVCQLFKRDPRNALPRIDVYGGPAADIPAAGTPDASWRWEARYDLLKSEPDDRHFVVEIDDQAFAHLRVGDGTLGRQPQGGDLFRARTRVGNGPAGNVGRDSIVWMALTSGPVSGAAITPRNPIAASGGTAPEDIAEAKLYAPGSFRAIPLRAITADDYAKIAGQIAGVQGAACTLAWTGSWYEANVAIDPLGTETLEASLDRKIEGTLHKYRRIGHDLEVGPARYVPLAINLSVCVLPDFLTAHVEAALIDRFTSGARRDGYPGFFNPDLVQLGAPIYLSTIVAEAQSVTGVAHVEILSVDRLDGEWESDPLSSGLLPLGKDELAQVDSDPDFPEHGSIVFKMGGGR
jgi:hypothetical protein